MNDESNAVYFLCLLHFWQLEYLLDDTFEL